MAADPTGTIALPGNTGLVVLDTVVTPELAREGLGRDVVRLVQQARRDAGLEVSDRIALILDAPEPVVDAVREHETFVAGEVLATSVEYAPAPEPTLLGTVSDGHEVRVLVNPAPAEPGRRAGRAPRGPRVSAGSARPRRVRAVLAGPIGPARTPRPLRGRSVHRVGGLGCDRG